MAQFLTMVATNVDRGGKAFVSVWEGANGLPITATQFHPERQVRLACLTGQNHHTNHCPSLINNINSELHAISHSLPVPSRRDCLQYLEWKEGIGANHDWDVIVANRWFADYFLMAARRNNHSWDPALTPAYSVYSYTPNAQGDPMDAYQGYVFDF